MSSYVHTLSASLLALSLTSTIGEAQEARARTPAQPSKATQAAPQTPAREQAAEAQVERVDPVEQMEPPVGHITDASGPVTLERANQIEDAAPGLPLMAGDRLRTENASADITWADSTTLRLARFTELDLLSRHMVRVPRGTLNINLVLTPGQAASEQLALDAPSASIRFFAAGRYRVSVSGSDEVEVELAVIEGHAQLVSDQGQVALAAGEKALVRGGEAPTAPAALTAQVNDASSYDYSADVATFQSSGQGYASTQYLPSELYGYASVLDQNGTWQSDPSYGFVWYPRVAADWRPYSHGQWRFYKPWGWTWIGRDRWAYPTHHYGRWGIGARGWYWIPARQWGPAWVSWGISSNYVSWCPLGWDGRPVVNIYNYTTVHTGPAYRRPGRSWTVVPSRRFGYHDVTRYRINDEVVYRDRPAFITQRFGPPIARSGPAAVPRSNVIVPRSNVAIPRTAGDIGNVRGGSSLGRIEPLHEPTNVNVPPGVYYRRVPGDRDGDGYRSESPYERARRVMERRGEAQGRDGAPQSPNGSIDVNGAGQTSPTAVPRGGVMVPGDPNAPQYIYPGSRVPYVASPRTGGSTPPPASIDTAPRRGPGRSGGSLDDAPARRSPAGGTYRERSEGSAPPPAASSTPPPPSSGTAVPRASRPPDNEGGANRPGRSSGRSGEGRSGSGRRQP